jgi:hypothetical protein
MALANSMKNFVNDLKASRRSRHEFVKGNKAIAKSIMADNREFLQNIRGQNKINAEQVHAFLEATKEERTENYKTLIGQIREDIARIHNAKEAITQGARGMLKEFREDNQAAHAYWASLSTDEPIEEPKVVSQGVKGVKSKPHKEVQGQVTMDKEQEK